MRTRDQRYATTIHKQVQTVKTDCKADYRKYGVMCHKLPILIHTAGLAQALAFVESRDKPIYKRFLQDLTQTLELEGDLCEQARTVELNNYMRLTWQVMAALVWYKRFAQSILGVDVSENDDQEAR